MFIVEDAQTEQISQFCHVALQTIFSVLDQIKAWINQPKPRTSKGMLSVQCISVNDYTRVVFLLILIDLKLNTKRNDDWPLLKMLAETC